MKVYLTRRYLFVASHRLHNPALSEAANRESYGKCNHPHGHGHNYFLEVTVSGPIAHETGTVCDLSALDSIVTREILDRFDHQNLNELEDFSSDDSNNGKSHDPGSADSEPSSAARSS